MNREKPCGFCGKRIRTEGIGMPPFEATEAEWDYLNELIAPLVEAGWIVRELHCHHWASDMRTLEAALVRDGGEVHVELDEEEYIEVFVRPLDWEYDGSVDKGEPLIRAEGTEWLFAQYADQGWLMQRDPRLEADTP